jgi:hypothetical protein
MNWHSVKAMLNACKTDLIIVAWHRSGIGAWYWAVLPYPANEPVLRAADSRERGIMSETRLERRSAFVNSLPAEYFLFVGALEPDKNLALCRGSIRTWPCAGGAYQLAASASVSSSHSLSSLVPACRAAEEVKAPADPIYSVGTFFAARLDHALLEEKDTSYLLARNSDRFLT